MHNINQQRHTYYRVSFYMHPMLVQTMDVGAVGPGLNLQSVYEALTLTPSKRQPRSLRLEDLIASLCTWARSLGGV
jgi:hypothetical protein